LRARLLSLLLGTLGFAGAAMACDGPAMTFEPLAAHTWWIPGAPGDSNAGNRGRSSAIVLHREGQKVWLIGSGPSPIFGQALACHAAKVAGAAVTDVVNTWPRPEAVLGNGAFATARLWAHAAVKQAMAEQCAHCTERLRARMGDAAADLGVQPVVLPRSSFEGAQGQLGPWDWWLLQRMPQVPVTVFHLRGTALWLAPGVLWHDGAPDMRDSRLGPMQRATQALFDRLALPDPRRLWLGEQGPVLSDEQARAHALYWQALEKTIDRLQAAGGSELDVVKALPGVPAWMTGSERHVLNWQRAWREIESR
jgi:hypothetical protein